VVAAKPALAGAAPAAKPAAPLTIASIANAALENGPPVKLKPHVAAAATPAPTMSATAAPTAGWAQIGAFSSTALADKGWHDTVKFAPDAMAGKGVQIQPASVNGKTFYRTYVTGFPSHAAAEAFCGKLKAANKPCIVK
jgi:cell division protein FtsN